MSNYIFCRHKNSIFFATGDVILMSYLQVNNTFHGTTVHDKNLNAMNIKF